MNAKERFYSGMARETISQITASKENWTAFLTTMARNYEFTYPEQVMIYAQRPNATFLRLKKAKRQKLFLQLPMLKTSPIL